MNTIISLFSNPTTIEKTCHFRKTECDLHDFSSVSDATLNQELCRIKDLNCVGNCNKPLSIKLQKSSKFTNATEGCKVDLQETSIECSSISISLPTLNIFLSTSPKIPFFS